MTKIFLTAALAAIVATSSGAATLISASSAGNFVNTGPGLTFSDTATFSSPTTNWTNGSVTLTYSGDFQTTGGEFFDFSLDGNSLGILSNGNTADDLFSNGSDTTEHDLSVTITAALNDSVLNSILADQSVTMVFTDITPPADWIDWVNTFDWSISADEASTSAVPLPAALPLMLLALGGVGALQMRRRSTESA